MIKDMNSGKFLSIIASSPDDGANGWIWHDDGTDGQRFHIVNYYGIYYKFLTKCSNYTKALAVDDSTHNIYQTDAGSSFTLFYLEDASAKYGVPAGKGYLQSEDTLRFLRKSTSFWTPNKIVQSNIDSDIISDGLFFTYLGAGYYRIDVSSNKCLSVKNNNVSNGLQAAAYSGATGQQWKANTDGESITLSPKCNTGYYLSIDASNNGHNKELIVSNNASNSRFWLFYNAEYISDVTDYTDISFSDYSHAYCAGHLNLMPLSLKSYSGQLSDMKSVFVGYNDGTSMASEDFSYIASRSDFLTIRAHGGTSLQGVYMSLNSKDLNGNNTETQIIYNYDDLPEMDNCILTHFFVCFSGNGLYSNANADNFLTYAVDQCGVSYAIGYDGSVDCDYGEVFVNRLDVFLDSGDSIYAAIIDALDRMKEEVEEGELNIDQNRLVVVSAYSIITINPLTGDRIHNFR